MADARSEAQAKLEFQPQVDQFIRENADVLDAEATDLLRDMEVADQRRVLAVGPVRRCDDPANVLRSRVRVARENEELYKKATTGEFQISHLVKAATEEEVELFIAQNRQFLDELGIKEFRGMNGKDQARVIADGPLNDCQDAASVVQARAKRAREMENQVVEMMCKSQKQKLQPKKNTKAPPDPVLAAKYNESFVSAPLKEVPAEERRFAPAAGSGPPPEPEAPTPALVGTVKGIGGVVEVIKAKYGCQRGQRLRVVGESGGAGGLWKLEGEKTLPKTQLNQGWRWVLPEAPEPKKAPTPAARAADAPAAGAKAEGSKNEGSKAAKAASRSRSRSGGESSSGSSGSGKRRTHHKGSDGGKRTKESASERGRSSSSVRSNNKGKKVKSKDKQKEKAKERGKRRRSSSGSGRRRSSDRSSGSRDRRQARGRSRRKNRSRGKSRPKERSASARGTRTGRARKRSQSGSRSGGRSGSRSRSPSKRRRRK